MSALGDLRAGRAPLLVGNGDPFAPVRRVAPGSRKPHEEALGFPILDHEPTNRVPEGCASAVSLRLQKLGERADEARELRAQVTGRIERRCVHGLGRGLRKHVGQ